MYDRHEPTLLEMTREKKKMLYDERRSLFSEIPSCMVRKRKLCRGIVLQWELVDTKQYVMQNISIATINSCNL